MKFERNKTNRGFNVLTFYDDYNIECSLQKSSSVVDHIWLGIDRAKPIIMCSDARKLGLSYAKYANGWQDFEVPEEVLIRTRMHLTKRQARKLAMKLLRFGLFGKV